MSSNGKKGSRSRKVWLDGTCRACGSDVLETASYRYDADYMNRCSNAECEHHVWHHVCDQDEQDYYEHARGNKP